MRDLDWAIWPAVLQLDATRLQLVPSRVYRIKSLDVESAIRVAQALSLRYGIRFKMKVAK